MACGNGNKGSRLLAETLCSGMFNPVVSREISMLEEIVYRAALDMEITGETCVTIEDGTPMTYTGAIQSIKVLSGGQGYFPVFASAEIISSSGTDAELSLIIEDGVIVDVIINNPGTLYVLGDTIQINHPNGNNFEATLDIDSITGEIVEITIINGGSGYGPLFPGIEVTGGQGGLFSPVVNLSTGEIESIQVVESGFGYSSDSVVIIHPVLDSNDIERGSGAVACPLVICKPFIDLDNSKYYHSVSDQTDGCTPADKSVREVLSSFTSRGFRIEVDVNPKTQNTIRWKICWC